MVELDLKFSAAEINLLLHATEDVGKVLRSIEEVLAVPPERFSSAPLEGHYRNKISILKAILSSLEAGALAVRVMQLLNSSDKQHLFELLPEYSDEKGNLYLRLDKQRMCQGKVSLSETDSIRIRFKPIKRYRPSGTIDTYRGLLSSIE